MNHVQPRLPRRLAAASLAGLLLFAADDAAALANFVTVATPAGTPYWITYLNDTDKWTVTDVSFAALAGEFAGTLTKKVTFKTADPFIIKFTQKAPAADYSAASGGFKVNLKLEVTNGMNRKWDSFSEELKDFDFTDKTKTLDGAVRGSNTHPLFAHFHPTGMDMANYKQTGFKKTDPADFDTLRLYSAIDGPVNAGQKWTAEGFFLHAMNIKALPRTFSWIETPVAAPIPEPATWMLLCAGLLAVAQMAPVARRRQAEPGHGAAPAG